MKLKENISQIKSYFLYILILTILFSQSCKTDNETIRNIDTTLYTIDSGFASITYHSVRFVEHGPDVWIIKRNDSLCKLRNNDGSWNIDTILCFRGSKSFYLSTYHRINNSNGIPNTQFDSLVFVSFRKMKWITKDSIVGEYFNTNFFSGFDHGGNYILVPDSGNVIISLHH